MALTEDQKMNVIGMILAVDTNLTFLMANMNIKTKQTC